MSYLRNEGEMLPDKAHTEMLAQQFWDKSYQSFRVDHKATYKTICPLRLLLNDAHIYCLRQHRNNKKQINRSEYKKALKRNQPHAVCTQLNKDSKQLGTTKIAEQFASTKNLH